MADTKILFRDTKTREVFVLKVVSNYSQTRLIDMCCDALSQPSVTGKELIEWGLKEEYFEKENVPYGVENFE